MTPRPNAAGWRWRRSPFGDWRPRPTPPARWRTPRSSAPRRTSTISSPAPTPAAPPTTFPRRWGPAPARALVTSGPGHRVTPHLPRARAGTRRPRQLARSRRPSSTRPSPEPRPPRARRRRGWPPSRACSRVAATWCSPARRWRRAPRRWFGCSTICWRPAAIPAAFAGAVANGTALDMIDELGQRHHGPTPPGGGGVGRPSGTGGRGRRRPRDGGAAERDPAADFDDFFAAPTPAASPTDWPWPSVMATRPARGDSDARRSDGCHGSETPPSATRRSAGRAAMK